MDQLIINYMTEEQYANSEKNDNEFYITPETSQADISVIFTTEDPTTMTGLIPGTLIVSTFNSTSVE